MGCSLYKVHNQTSPIVKAVNLSTHTTKHMQTSQFEENKAEESCLKIKLYEDDEVDWECMHLRVSRIARNMMVNCEEIYCKSNQFFSTLAYFEQIVHGVCVEEFSLNKGIELVLVYANLNGIKVFIRKSKFFAYLDVKDGKEIEVFQVWNRIGDLIKGFLGKNELEKQYSEIKDYMGEKCFWDFDENNVNVFEILNEYLELYKGVIRVATEGSKAVCDYIHGLKNNLKIVEQKIIENNLPNGANFVAIAHNIIH